MYFSSALEMGFKEMENLVEAPGFQFFNKQWYIAIYFCSAFQTSFKVIENFVEAPDWIFLISNDLLLISFVQSLQWILMKWKV